MAVEPGEVEASRPDRRNKRLLGYHADEPVHRKVKMLAAREGTTVCALLNEAVGDLIKKYDLPPTSS